MSAVSKKLTPASRAPWTTFIEAVASRRPPKLLPPMPTTETRSDPRERNSIPILCLSSVVYASSRSWALGGRSWVANYDDCKILEGVPMKVSVDYDLCTSNAVCMGIAPEVFEVRDDGFLYVLNENPGPEFDGRLREAVASCPNGAISIEE